jgi:hypothetical protein
MPCTQTRVAQDVRAVDQPIGFALLDLEGRRPPTRLDRPPALCVMSAGRGARNRFLSRAHAIGGNIANRAGRDDR